MPIIIIVHGTIVADDSHLVMARVGIYVDT